MILVFDGDKAGKEAAEKSLPRFLSQDVDLRILTLTSEKDPADFLVSQGASAFEKLLESAAEAWEYKLRLCIERIGVDSVDGREQIVAEMLELFRQAPGFGGSARENIVLNRLAFRVGLSETRIREMLVESRRKREGGSRHAAKKRQQRFLARLRRPVTHRLKRTRCERPARGRAARDRPFGSDGGRRACVPASSRRIPARALPPPFGDLLPFVEEGKHPSYEKVMSAAEDPILKQLVVTLESVGTEAKGPPDCALDSHEEPGGRHALLVKLIKQLKQRADAQDASLERLAIQSGLAGAGPAQATGPARSVGRGAEGDACAGRRKSQPACRWRPRSTSARMRKRRTKPGGFARAAA